MVGFGGGACDTFDAYICCRVGNSFVSLFNCVSLLNWLLISVEVVSVRSWTISFFNVVMNSFLIEIKNLHK